MKRGVRDLYRKRGVLRTQPCTTGWPPAPTLLHPVNIPNTPITFVQYDKPMNQ
jgi:hypothetical protein